MLRGRFCTLRLNSYRYLWGLPLAGKEMIRNPRWLPLAGKEIVRNPPWLPLAGKEVAGNPLWLPMAGNEIAWNLRELQNYNLRPHVASRGSLGHPWPPLARGHTCAATRGPWPHVAPSWPFVGLRCSARRRDHGTLHAILRRGITDFVKEVVGLCGRQHKKNV